MSQTFTLELGDRGGSHHFASASALRSWVNEENNKWSWVQEISDDHIVEAQRKPLTEQQLTAYLRQAEACETSNSDHYQKQMNAAITYIEDVFLSDRLPIYSGSKEGRFVLNHKERIGSSFASSVLGTWLYTQ